MKTISIFQQLPPSIISPLERIRALHSHTPNSFSLCLLHCILHGLNSQRCIPLPNCCNFSVSSKRSFKQSVDYKWSASALISAIPCPAFVWPRPVLDCPPELFLKMMAFVLSKCFAFKGRKVVYSK